MEIFTAQEFLSTFFSALKLKNVNVVSSDDLFTLIGKYRDEYLDLFIDIDITNNSGTICSDDLEDGISMLQIIGAVGKANPRYEKIILKMHKDSANEMLETCNPKQRNSIERFVEAFLSEVR